MHSAQPAQRTARTAHRQGKEEGEEGTRPSKTGAGTTAGTGRTRRLVERVEGAQKLGFIETSRQRSPVQPLDWDLDMFV